MVSDGFLDVFRGYGFTLAIPLAFVLCSLYHMIRTGKLKLNFLNSELSFKNVFYFTCVLLALLYPIRYLNSCFVMSLSQLLSISVLH